MLILMIIMLLLLWLAETDTTEIPWRGNCHRKSSPELAGEMGECQLIRKLLGCRGQGHILHHVYVPLRGGGLTEIDVILINEHGIAVFENKHYSGVIYGNYSDPFWRHLFQGKSYDIYSPVFQNRNHIKALMELPGMQHYKKAVYGIVTFSGRKEFKVNRLERDRDKVCHISRVCEIVQNRNSILSEREIHGLYQAILPFTHVFAEQKQNHINRVSLIKNREDSFQ